MAEKESLKDTFIDSRIVSVAKVCSEITSICVFLVGVLALVGWEYDVDFLASFSPQSVFIKPNAAVGLVFLGFSLWLLQQKRLTKLISVLGRGCALVAFMLGFLTFIEYVFGIDLRIDQVFFTSPASHNILTIFPGRMGFAAALNLTLSGLALVFLGKETDRGILLAQILSIFSGIIALITIIGYIFSVSSFYTGIAIYAATSQYFAISIFFVQLGTVFARPGHGLSRVFVTNGTSGKLSRSLFPATFLVPLFFGWLLQKGEFGGFYGQNFEMALQTTASVVTLSLLVTYIGILLGKNEEDSMRLEKALFKNEEKYHNLVNLMNEGLLVQNKNGILTLVNRRACEMSGYKLAELIGKPVGILFNKENQKILKNQMIKRRIGGHESYEIKWLRKDGTTLDTIASPTPFFDAAGNFSGSMSVFADITERKKIELEREQFFKFFNLSSDIMVIADPNGAFKKVNPVCIDALGYSESELISKPFIDFVYPDDKQPTLEEMARQIKIGSSLNFENRYVCKDGRVLWLSWRASYDKSDNTTYATARDITQQKKILEEIESEQLKSAALAKDLEKFKLAADNVPDHVMIMDNNGVILYVNKAAINITGYSENELVGTRIGKTWGARVPKDFYEKLWYSINNENKVFFGEVLNFRKNNQPYTAELIVAPILDQNNRVQFMVGIERDVTMIREMDQMKTDFISFASHQLRTPLTIIKWNTEMLRNGDAGKLTREQKHYLVEIERGEKRMALLISSLLNISRLESGRMKVEPKSTDIIELMSDTIAELSPYGKVRNCSIVFNKPQQSTLLVSIDTSLFKQVFSNLLTNAIHYSKPEKCKVEVDFKEITGYYQIDVIDDGIGIPAAAQNNIFNKFFRAENATQFDTEGTGLGLYMVKLIVEKSGGKVWFESTEGKGSAFHFTIPKSGMKKIAGEKELAT